MNVRCGAVSISLVIALLSFVPLSIVLRASAQQSRTNKSWLDHLLVNWNQQGSNFPQLPRPSATMGAASWYVN
jgi:hypothetical protein